MATVTRRVEVFTAGCPICDEMVNVAKSLAYPSCEMQVYDLREGGTTSEGRKKAARYGVAAVPAIAMNGAWLECGRREPVAADILRAAGIGQS